MLVTSLIRGIVRAVLLAAAALPVACSAIAPQIPGAAKRESAPQLSEAELRTLLEDFSVRFSSHVQTAADHVATSTSDQELRRNTVAWKLRLVTECRAALQTSNEVGVLLNLWTLCVQMQNFFATDQAPPAFESSLPRVRLAATDVLADIEGVAHAAFADALFDRVRADVETFARENPFAPGAVRKPYRVPAKATSGGHYETMLTVLSAPLSPFNVVKGIDEGASAIHQLAEAIDRTRAAAQDLPEEVCWRTELLLYDAERHESAKSLVASMERASLGIESLSSSSERLATAVDRAPADLQRVIDTTLDRSAAVQTDLRTTIERADHTLARLENVSTELGTMTRDVEKTATAVGTAGSAWQGTFESFRAMVDDLKDDDGESHAAPSSGPPDVVPAGAAPASGGGGFDINDYDKTAKSISGAAEELRGLIVELRGLLHPDELGKALELAGATTQSSVQFTSGEAISISDHLAKRAAQLIGLVFVALLAYRFLSVRMARK